MQTSTDELGAYSEGELLEDAHSESLSAIQPLSPKSLKAIANLARYKPPPDPCPWRFPSDLVLVLWLTIVSQWQTLSLKAVQPSSFASLARGQAII